MQVTDYHVLKDQHPIMKNKCWDGQSALNIWMINVIFFSSSSQSKIYETVKEINYTHDQLNGGTEHIIIGNHAVLDLTCKV